MLPGVLHFRQGFACALCIGVLAVLVTSVGLNGQTPKRNIFDDDPAPFPGTTNPGTTNPNAPRPAAPVSGPAPAQGLAPGLLGAMYEGPTPDSKLHEHHLSPTLGISFEYPATSGFIPMSFTFQGMINVPAGGAQGLFHFDTTGDSELTIDGQRVSSIHLGDAAGTFEHQVNLPPGLHSLNATVTKLHGTGARQRMELIWKPLSGLNRKLPKEWCWHSKADEPADLLVLTREGSPAGSGPAPTVVWVRGGTPRPADPSARAEDVLNGVVLASYAGHSLDRLNVFGVVPSPSFNLTIGAGRTDGDGFYNESVKMNVAIKINAECQCAFDCVAPGQLAISVDQHVVTRSGYPAEAAVREAMTLKPGYHALELTVTKITGGVGIHHMALVWQVNNSAFSPLPPDSCSHFRWQELYADGAAAGGPGQPAPQAFPGQQNLPGQPAVPAPLVRTNKLPVPDAAAQAKAVADLRNRYAGAWGDPGTAQQAGFLISAAGASRDDPVASYVLLDRAYRQAQSAGAAALALQAIDLLASQFTVDSVQLKLTVLQGLGAKRKLDAGNATLLAGLFDQAMLDANYAAACDVAGLSLADARERNLPGEVAAATGRVARATAANAEWQQIKPMVARLAENASDPAANLAVGRFYCFVAKNWQRGAPLLAQSNEPVFAWLGRHEAMVSQGSVTQSALADAWWDAADGQTGAVAAAMRERAAQWYMVAEPGLSGLSRRVAGARFQKISAIARVTSPLISQAPQPVMANNPATPAQYPAAGPAQNQAAPPPENGQTHRIHYNPGPLVMVIDRAAVSAQQPRRIGNMVSCLQLESFVTEPTAAVTVIIADTPPVVFNYTAGDFKRGSDLYSRIDAALRAVPAGSDLDAGLAMAMKINPARLGLFADTSISAEHIAAIFNEHDPEKKMRRLFRLFGSDREGLRTKMQELMQRVGGMAGGGTTLEPPPQ